MLTKMVNGIKTVCSPEEEAEIRASWLVITEKERLRQEIRELETKKRMALDSLENITLSIAVLDPNAPQEVKDYAELLRTTGK